MHSMASTFNTVVVPSHPSQGQSCSDQQHHLEHTLMMEKASQDIDMTPIPGIALIKRSLATARGWLTDRITDHAKE